jgi:hypothetical protein
MRDKDQYKQERREWRERQRERRREWRYRHDDWHDDNGWHGRHHWHQLGSGVSLLIIGCVLIGVGLSLGGRWNAIPWWPWNSDSHVSQNWNDGKAGRSASAGGKIEDKTGTVSASVKRIDIKLTASNLVIRSASGTGNGTYAVRGFESNSLHISSDNDRLEIDEADWGHLIDLGNNTPKAVIEIELPAGITLESCRIHVGAGSARFENISSNVFTADSGAGSIRGTTLNAKNVTISTGAGSIDLDGCTFEETKVSTGAGRFAYTGMLGKRTEISTGAGSVELSLKGKKDDYRIDYARGVGSVRVDGESFTGVGNGTAGNGNADRRIKVSSGVGSVRIDFAE